MASDYTKRIPADSLRFIWRYAAGFAVLTTSVLVATGVDSFLDEMRTLHWGEVFGITYCAFVLPWYLTVVGGIALKCWQRQGDFILVPEGNRIIHLLNLVFIIPGVVASLLFLYTIMMWAFGPKPSGSEWFIIIAFILIVELALAKACWRFVRDTFRAAFQTQKKTLSDQG